VPGARSASEDGATSGGSYWASATSAIPSTVSTRRETDNQSFSGFMAAGNLRRFAAGVKDFVPATVTFIYGRMTTLRATRPKLERRRARRLAGRGAGLRCPAS